MLLHNASNYDIAFFGSRKHPNFSHPHPDVRKYNTTFFKSSPALWLLSVDDSIWSKKELTGAEAKGARKAFIRKMFKKGQVVSMHPYCILFNKA